MTLAMRRRPRIVTALPLLAIPLLGSCVAPQVAQAPVAPLPPVRTALSPPPAPDRAWTEAPVTPGAWRYRADGGDTVATFADPAGAPLFEVRCRAHADVAFRRPGVPQPVTIQTTGPSEPMPFDRDNIAFLPARNPFLDQIAFSRGRIMVSTPPLPSMIVPVQAEISRVIEDCRG